MDVERYRKPAYATALAVLGDHHLAEDAVQDAMIEALRSWEGLRDPTKRPAWIRSIVRHRCYRLLRRRDMGALPMPELVSHEEPWRLASRHEASQRVLGAMRVLPRALRDVVALHYLGGCSHRETAAFLEVPISTVNNRLHRARSLMKGPLPVSTTSFAGTVIATPQPFVDVRFVEEGLPEVFDALALAGTSPAYRVVQGARGWRRPLPCAWRRDPCPRRASHQRDRGWGTLHVRGGGRAHARDPRRGVGTEQRGAPGTGIKPIDLFCPLPAGGTVATLGTSGTRQDGAHVGAAPALGDGGPQLVYLADRSEPALVRDLRDEEAAFDSRALWVLDAGQ